MSLSDYGKVYLEQYGWKDGTPLQSGGLKKPILVKHKFDQKGLGSNPQDNVAWWERVFDGQLKSMQLGDQGFVQDEKKKSEWELEDRRRNSPLYKVFVKGQGLKGSFEKEESAGDVKDSGVVNRRKMRIIVETAEASQLMVFDSSDDESSQRKKAKRVKKEKKDKKRDKKNKKKDDKAKLKAQSSRKDKKELKKQRKQRKLERVKSGKPL